MGKFLGLPRMAVTMNEGFIGTWYVNNGDTVSQDQKLFQLESGKSVDDIASPYAGVITILQDEGAEVEVGVPVAFIGAPNEALPEVPEKVI